jgi:hypothetical protein
LGEQETLLVSRRDDRGAMREHIEAQLSEATAELTAHMATFEYAYAMGASAHGGSSHPLHRRTRVRTERLAARCRELQAQLDALDA